MLALRRTLLLSPSHNRRLLHIHNRSSQNLVEKIVQRYTLDSKNAVKSGDFVMIKPEHVMTHDNTGAVMKKFKSIGAAKFKNPKQAVFTLDHDVQNTSSQNLTKYKSIELFAHEHGVDFFPAGRGIGHQIMIEEGYAFPYTLTVASDSHSNMYGGVGCLGTPVVRTDAAAIWATGQTWWQVPPVVKVELRGELPSGCTGKDVIITLCGLFNRDEVLNSAIEFSGDGINGLCVEDRLAIANMTTEWGALAGLFPVDDVTIRFLRKRANRLLERDGKEHIRVNEHRIRKLEEESMQSDKDAKYSKHLTLDLSSLSPRISGPNSVKVSTPIHELEKSNVAIQKAYLVSCVNSRATDIHQAAQIIRGRKVAEGVEFYIAAASSEVQKDAEIAGDWQALLEAGARPLPAGCGPCIGLGAGLLRDGEVGISATNRNFKGRMGSHNALAYLASPAVVAASAVAGKIISPASLLSTSATTSPRAEPVTSIKVFPQSDSISASTSASHIDILPKFPATIEGELVFCDTDNLNTDGIYPGKYTYNDDMKMDDMKKVAMENYDSNFTKIIKPTDILVGGFNFGTGSSREQAATALKANGITLLLAGSFSETFKRNSINNALLVLEAPELVNHLREYFKGEKVPTRRTGLTAKLNVVTGQIEIETKEKSKKYFVGVLGRSVQELWCAGGLEAWVRERL
ncbi:uncharacterized protein VTP21DRAFT_566 [Calcarisporiella thermophila]|uniref:uncharacterized protein n=1 Tax=Calcarisporiella thermophila TaxID=911321 RepID=UPI003744AC88